MGDDITTDHIVPAGAHFLPIRCNIPEVSKYVFKVVDESFSARAKEAGSGFIIGGHNYGQGSSREQAALAPRYLGIRAVIAKSFARIHLANLVNFGLIPFVFVDEDDFDRFDQGDSLSINTTVLQPGMQYTVRNHTKGIDVLVVTPLYQDELDIIRVGGGLNWIKQRNS